MVILLGGLGGALVILAIWMTLQAEKLDFVPPRAPTSNGINKPILALELPQTSMDVDRVVGDRGDPRREIMERIQRADYGFIVLYWLLFCGLGALLIHNRPDYRTVAWIGIVCATIGAAFDVLEDGGIFEILRSPLQGNAEALQKLIDHTRHCALTKWGFLFVALLTLSSLFFVRGGWLSLLGVLFVAAALCGFAGLLMPSVLQLAGNLMAAGIVLATAALLVVPGRFLPR